VQPIADAVPAVRSCAARICFRAVIRSRPAEAHLESPRSLPPLASKAHRHVHHRHQRPQPVPRKVKQIIEGPVVSEIDVETTSGLIVTSVITTRSVKDLRLVVG
jgi:hypothetical protein